MLPFLLFGLSSSVSQFHVFYAMNSNVIMGYSRERVAAAVAIATPPITVGFAFNRSAFSSAFA